MNRTFAYLPTMALAILLGCIPSFHPLYTTKDLVFDQALLGTWSQDDHAEDWWKFEKRDDLSYKLTITDGQKTSPFVAHLVQLGDKRFLDLCPDKNGLDDTEREGLYKAAFIAGHLIVKVSQIQPTLKLSMFDPEWLGKLLEKDPKAISHKKVSDNELVFMASTQELQAFVIKHTDTQGAWGEKLAEFKQRAPK
jgi:hypothetical protein